MKRLTLALPDLRYPSGQWKNGFDIVAIVTAPCVAAYLAITLDYVALYDLGFSGEQVRGTAMIAAVAVDFYGKKLRNNN